MTVVPSRIGWRPSNKYSKKGNLPAPFPRRSSDHEAYLSVRLTIDPLQHRIIVSMNHFMHRL
jgi:hypothetical protein